MVWGTNMHLLFSKKGVLSVMFVMVITTSIWAMLSDNFNKSNIGQTLRKNLEEDDENIKISSKSLPSSQVPYARLSEVNHNEQEVLDYKLLRDSRKTIQRLLTEAKEMQEFARQISSDPNSIKSKILIEDYKKDLLPLNNLALDIRSLNDAIHEESKDELEKLHRIVQNRIKELQNPKDCKNAKKLVCREVPFCGLGCTFHHFGICSFIALGTNRTMILDTKQIPYEGANEVFQPFSETCSEANLTDSVEWKGDYKGGHLDNHQVVTVSIVEAKFRDTHFAPYTIPASLKEKLLRHHDDPNNWWIGQIMEYLTRLQPWVLDKIEDVKRSINLIHPYVGVHIRRTDKITENKYHNLTEYMLNDPKKFKAQLTQWISIGIRFLPQIFHLSEGVLMYKVYVEEWYNSYNKKNGLNVARKVYITTDDTELFERAIKRYPKYKFYQNPDVLHTYIGESDQRYMKEELVLFVCDMMILSQSNYFVGTFSSNIGRLIMQLMQARQDATSMTRSLDLHSIYFGGHPRYHEAIQDHVSNGIGDMYLKTGDRIATFTFQKKKTSLYTGFGINSRTFQVGLYPLHTVKEVIITAPYPGFDA